MPESYDCYRLDDRIVLTLDAGGTNMVFGAMKGGEFVVEPLNFPSFRDGVALGPFL